MEDSENTLGDLGGQLSFWSELRWLESPSGEWHYVQRKVPHITQDTSLERKKKKKNRGRAAPFSVLLLPAITNLSAQGCDYVVPGRLTKTTSGKCRGGF
ncbi:jg19903 [Pararge aegeria aegeria]|uniref:Jg19903 protein n=1 Tax=Pararge aegeria aegeria TaxID=348720 RepID=A0A8S4SE16_9NEOP|nr:jg19903 [Pararge aegeria aegeria]